MANYPVSFDFDDGGLTESLEKQTLLYEKLQSELKDTEAISRKTFQNIGNDLDKTQTKAKASVGAIATAAKATSEDIGAVALKIAMNVEATGSFEAALKKLNDASLSGVTAEIDNIEEEFAKLIEKVELTEDELKILVDNSFAVGEALATISSGELGNIADESEEVTKKFKTAKAELRELKNLLTSGQLTGEEFEKAQARAAELTDQIGDANERIKNLASDTKGIDTLIDGTRAIAAGFAIAEGAAALFGVENEDTQKALVKLNAIMAISNGLQEAHALLLQNSNLRMRIASIQQGVYSVVVGTSSGALKVFRIALAATGIGLAVIALGALIANFDKVKAKTLEWVPGLEKLGSIISGVKEAFFSFFGSAGDIFTAILNRDFKGAFDAFKNIGKDAGNAFIDGYKDNEKGKADLAEKSLVDGVISAQKKKLEILQAQGKDTAKVQNQIFENEARALRLSGATQQEIDDKIHEQRVFNNQRATELAEKAAKEREKRIEEEKKRQEEYLAAIQQINNEILQADRANQLNAIGDDTIEKKIERIQLQQKFDQEDLEARKKVTLNLAKDAQERAKIEEVFGLLAIEAAKKVDSELLEIEKESRGAYILALNQGLKETDEAIKKNNADKLKQEFATRQAVIQLTRDLELEKIDLELEYGDISQLQREQLEKRKLELILASYKAQRSAFGLTVNEETVKLDGLIKGTEKEIERFEKETSNPIANAGKKFKDLLGKTFGLDGPETDLFIQGFTALKDAVLDVVTSGFELELDLIDQTIEKREKAIEELGKSIEDEKKRKEDGYSNDYDSLLEKQADEELLLKEDNKKRIEIQKAQLKAETAIQAAQQVGALITAVANITASGSKFGLLGIPLIAAAVISMFALFRNYKSQAKSITSQTAYKGGLIGDYLNPGQTAKSDRPGRGIGHRVEGTNLSVGADEFLINAVATSGNMPFLKAFNKGKFNGIDLMKVMAQKESPVTMLNHVLKIERNEREPKQENITAAIEKQTSALLKDNEKRPVIIQMPNGDVEVTYFRGSNVVRELIKKVG